MRRIEPLKELSLRQVKASEVGKDVPEIVYVHPQDLFVDDIYQRHIGEASIRLIRKIYSSWSWNTFTPPVVAPLSQGKGYEVVDGQHTAIAAATLRIPKIPVLVIKASETTDKAAAFIGHNTQRLNVTPMQIFHASVVRGDPAAVTVNNVAKELGITILRNTPGNGAFKPLDTVSVASLKGILARRGEEGLKRVLEIIAKASPAPSPISHNHLKALEHILYSDEYAEEINEALLSKAVGHDNTREVRSLAVTHDMPLWRATAILYFRAAKAGQAKKPKPQQQKQLTYV